uniref:Uncharacterized protein n=1 Tax=viral metagenome TaxID=1070528 RepID=A0A6M3LZA2_9ZZZZ
MNTSVIETLKVAGLYRDNGRMAEQTLKTILPDGQITEHLMAEIDYYDLKTLGDELEVKLEQENPIIQAIYARNAVAIANAVRVVNVDSASGFKGAVGSGRQLDAVILRPEQFHDPDLAAGVAPANRRVTWDRTIVAPGPPAISTALNYIVDDTCGIAGVIPLTMAATEALCLFAFTDPAAQPCVTAFQITYLGRVYNIQITDFDLTQVFSGFPLFELKEPLIIYPREGALIQAIYNREVTDEMRPIGLWIKMSQNLRALTIS